MFTYIPEGGSFSVSRSFFRSYGWIDELSIYTCMYRRRYIHLHVHIHTGGRELCRFALLCVVVSPTTAKKGTTRLGRSVYGPPTRLCSVVKSMCQCEPLRAPVTVVVSLLKIVCYFKAVSCKSIILSLPSPHLQRLSYCNPIVRSLRNIRPVTDPSCVCHTPYNIGDGNIV